MNAALITVGVVLFYAVLSRGLFRITEVFRWRALELGEHLIGSGQLTRKREDLIYRRLGDLHSVWSAWKLMFLMICVVFTLPFHKSTDDDNVLAGVPVHLRGDQKRFTIFWMLGSVGNSPVAAFLFTVMAIVVLAFFASVSALSMALFVSRGSHDRHDRHHKHA